MCSSRACVLVGPGRSVYSQSSVLRLHGPHVGFVPSQRWNGIDDQVGYAFEGLRTILRRLSAGLIDKSSLQ